MRVKELEEYKKAYSVEELIKVEYKNRKMALVLQSKAEFFKSKADMYLEMLLELENCDKEESNDK